MQKLIQPPIYLDHGLHVHKPRSFPPYHALTSCNPNQNRAALWRIFSSNKSAPANRKRGFYANRDPDKQEVGFIFAWTAQNFEVFSNIQELNLKIKNL